MSGYSEDMRVWQERAKEYISSTITAIKRVDKELEEAGMLEEAVSAIIQGEEPISQTPLPIKHAFYAHHNATTLFDYLKVAPADREKCFANKKILLGEQERLMHQVDEYQKTIDLILRGIDVSERPDWGYHFKSKPLRDVEQDQQAFEQGIAFRDEHRSVLVELFQRTEFLRKACERIGLNRGE